MLKMGLGIGGIILLIIAGCFVGCIMGIFGVYIVTRLLAIKLKREAKKFMEGTKSNIYNLDGKKMEVNKFIIRDGKGKETKVGVGEE